MKTPDYWADACKELSGRCAVMKRLVQSYNGEVLKTRGRAFETLARSIVGQQISVKAAQTVWNRFEALVDNVTPPNVLAHKVTQLREAGLSARKVEYMIDLAKHFESGQIKPRRWDSMDDEAIIQELIEVRGIGRWTAEMFLIFYLMRPNVFPKDDIGLLRGLERAYKLKERPTAKVLSRYQEKFAPWATVATWYLWRDLDPIPVEY